MMLCRETCLLFVGLLVGLKGSAIEKCCGPGEVFSVGHNFSCARTKNSNIPELFDVRGKLNFPHQNRPKYLYKNACSNESEVRIVKLDEINDDIIFSSFGCIDLFSDGDKLKDEIVPFVFYCRSVEVKNEEEKEKEEDNVMVLSVPRLTGFRACCSQGQVYDAETRDCVDKIVTESSEIVGKILEILRGTVEFVSVVTGPPTCQNALVDYFIEAKNLQVLPDGKLQALIEGTDMMEIILNEEISCIDVENTRSDFVVRRCSDRNFCEMNACIRKCCPSGEARVGSGCQKIPPGKQTGDFHRGVLNFTQAARNASKSDVLQTKDYGLLTAILNCSDGAYPVFPNESWHVTEKGHILVPNYRTYQHHEHCLEVIYNHQAFDDGIYPIICYETPAVPQIAPLRWKINGALEIMSCIFLLMTFLVYAFLPRLRNLHGKTLMCHVGSLFMAFLCLSIVALKDPPQPTKQKETSIFSNWNFCKFLSFSMLFFFHSAFSWLNVMCFDIWSTVGGFSTTGMGGKRRSQNRRFFIYCFYAWGLAFLLSSIAIAADHTDLIAQHLRPNLAINSCWFEQYWSNYGELIYFTVPMTFQLLANVVFFVLTSVHCSRVKAEITRMMATTTDPRSRRLEADQARLIMNVKLFIVMGITWTLEMASFFINRFYSDLKWREELFYIADVLNCLQGVLIFILFVMKKKVYHALRHRLGLGKSSGRTGLTNTGLQAPYNAQKSASCSTLMSTFAVNTAPD